jgi:hypothetical protein
MFVYIEINYGAPRMTPLGQMPSVRFNRVLSPKVPGRV